MFLLKFLWKVATFPFRLAAKVLVNLGVSLLISTILSVIFIGAGVALAVYGFLTYTPLGYLVGDPLSPFTQEQVTCMVQLAWNDIDPAEMQKFASSRDVSDLSFSSITTLLSNASSCR